MDNRQKIKFKNQVQKLILSIRDFKNKVQNADQQGNSKVHIFQEGHKN